MSEWQAIETAPRDGTPVMLFARCRTATAPIRVIGWHLGDRGWIECCFGPNEPVGLVPTHWMPLPEPPSGTAPRKLNPYDPRDVEIARLMEVLSAERVEQETDR